MKQPLFRILNELIEEGIIECDQFEDVLDEIKAAVLASQGFTYESIESRLDLYEGNLLEWTNSENDDGEFFREAFERFERELPETQERDRQIAERENAARANQTRAIQLILQGKNNQQIADAIGVSRQTVSFWQNQDEKFKADLNDEIKAWQDAHWKMRKQARAFPASPSQNGAPGIWAFRSVCLMHMTRPIRRRWHRQGRE